MGLSVRRSRFLQELIHRLLGGTEKLQSEMTCCLQGKRSVGDSLSWAPRWLPVSLLGWQRSREVGFLAVSHTRQASFVLTGGGHDGGVQEKRDRPWLMLVESR